MSNLRPLLHRNRALFLRADSPRSPPGRAPLTAAAEARPARQDRADSGPSRPPRAPGLSHHPSPWLPRLRKSRSGRGVA
jgi:hypothetical protein